MDTLSGGNSVQIIFASILKRVYTKGKNLLPLRAISTLKVAQFQKGLSVKESKQLVAKVASLLKKKTIYIV